MQRYFEEQSDGLDQNVRDREDQHTVDEHFGTFLRLVGSCVVHGEMSFQIKTLFKGENAPRN